MPLPPPTPVPTEHEPADWTRLHPAESIGVLVRVGHELGVGDADLLDGTELTPQQVGEARTQVSGVQEVQLIRNLQRAVPDHEHLGLLAGRGHHLTSYGALGMAFASADRLLDTLALGRRFQPLTHRWSDYQSAPTDDGVLVTWTADPLPADVRRFVLTRDMARAIWICREAMAGAPLQIPTTWSHPRPRSQEACREYLDLFGAAPQFDAESYSFSIDHETLARPLPQAAPITLHAMVEQCEQELAALRAAAQVSGQVQQLIVGNLAHGPSIESVARDLNTSPRTLRRQLAADGTTFRHLLESVRASQARHLLRETTLSIAQIAAQLGYENPPAFTTAFKRWHDLTPTQFRDHAA